MRHLSICVLVNVFFFSRWVHTNTFTEEQTDTNLELSFDITILPRKRWRRKCKKSCQISQSHLNANNEHWLALKHLKSLKIAYIFTTAVCHCDWLHKLSTYVKNKRIDFHMIFINCNKILVVRVIENWIALFELKTQTTGLMPLTTSSMRKWYRCNYHKKSTCRPEGLSQMTLTWQHISVTIELSVLW